MVEMKKQPTERLVPYYLIIVPRGQLWWIMDKKEKDKKERNKLQWHHTRIGLHWCSQTPNSGKGGKPCTVITTMVAPWWDSTTDFSLSYHKKNQKVYLKFEIKLKLTVKTCCRVGYKGNGQPFDTVIWYINHIIVTLLYVCICWNRTPHENYA